MRLGAWSGFLLSLLAIRGGIGFGSGFLGPVIREAALEYVPATGFTQIGAVIQPAPELRSTKLYFRAEQYPDFYYVEMTPERGSDSFTSVIPMPRPETTAVIYFVEAVDVDFQSVRSPEHRARVTDDTALAPLFMGGKPSITVGAVRQGAPRIPPGFLATGIVGFIGAAGGVVAGSSGGGMGAGSAAAVVGVAAGGAAVAGVAALEDTGSSTTTTAGAEGSTSSIPPTTTITTTTSTPPALKACFSTTPDPPVVQTGESIRLDGRCSEPRESIVNYAWDLGDGRRREGPFITPIYSTPGTYSVSLTVSDESRTDVADRTVTVMPRNEADLSVDIEITRKLILSGEVTYRITVINHGPRDARGVVLAATFPPASVFVTDLSSSERPFNCTVTLPQMTCPYPFTLMPARSTWIITIIIAGGFFSGVDISATSTVSSTDPPDPNPVNNRSMVMDTMLRAALEEPLDTFFASFMDFGSAGTLARGEIALDGAEVVGTESGLWFRHPIRGPGRARTVEAYLVSHVAAEGVWRFDFSGTTRFVAGSLEIQSGNVVALDGSSVGFLLTGTPGERVRFTYEMAR